MSEQRMTATQYLEMKGGLRPTSREYLLELGARAARIAAVRKLQALKIKDPAGSGYHVHTWPVDVWAAAYRGETAPARLATHRQIALMVLLATTTLNTPAGRAVLDALDNEMNEDQAGKIIKELGG